MMELTTDEDRAFQVEARAWLDAHLVGDFREHRGVGGPSDSGHWDLRLKWERLLARDKWLNISWPEEYGGRGGTYRQDLLFQIEHARAKAPYWVGVAGRDLFGPTLLAHGTPEQKARFLPRIAAAEEFWGQGFSEPEAGSDLASLRTRAVLDGDEWVIDGQKVWTTFGDRADWLYLLCRTDLAAPRHRGISMLLLPCDQQGVEIRPIRTMAGETEFSEVFLTGARTSKDLVVGPVNGGWQVVMGALGNERGGAVILPFQALFERELEELLARVRAWGVDHATRDRVLAAVVGFRVMQATTARSVSRVVAGAHADATSSIAKLYWANWHRDFGDLLMDVAGTAAEVLGPDYELAPYQRTFLSSRAETIYGGANEIQRNVIGEQVLGLPREPR